MKKRTAKKFLRLWDELQANRRSLSRVERERDDAIRQRDRVCDQHATTERQRPIIEREAAQLRSVELWAFAEAVRLMSSDAFSAMDSVRSALDAIRDVGGDAGAHGRDRLRDAREALARVMNVSARPALQEALSNYAAATAPRPEPHDSYRPAAQAD